MAFTWQIDQMLNGRRSPPTTLLEKIKVCIAQCSKATDIFC